MYTDGSCLNNPGSGGWACVTDNKFQIFGGDKDTTNNIMELTAVIEGLKKCLEQEEKNIIVFTDSNYVKQGITVWIKNWKLNGWLSSRGQSIKNKHLWKKLDTLTDEFLSVEWKWVKAHNGNTLNEKADKLARSAAELISQQ